MEFVYFFGPLILVSIENQFAFFLQKTTLSSKNTVCANDVKQQILPLNIQLQVNPLPWQKVVCTYRRVHLIVAYCDFGHFYNFWSIGFKYRLLAKSQSGKLSN